MAGQSTPGPSSASPLAGPAHVYYGGSRRFASRYRYSNPNSLSGFAELEPNHILTPEMLYSLLEKCDLVEKLEWQSTKISQENIGELEPNIRVFPKAEHQAQGIGSAMPEDKRFIKFQVTRYNHMSDLAPCPKTVTITFKDPPEHLVPNAWAILRFVCRGKELFPGRVHEWMVDALRRYSGQAHEELQRRQEEPAPGSISAEPRTKRANDSDASSDVSADEEDSPACLGEELDRWSSIMAHLYELHMALRWETDHGAFVRTELLDQALQQNVTDEVENEIQESTANATTKKYCEAVGLGDQEVSPPLVDAAVRHMHKILLCDTNPPWVDYQFRQALPEGSDGGNSE